LIIAPNPRPAENNVFLTQERNNNNKCKKKKTKRLPSTEIPPCAVKYLK
jgi:hypothetical protein